MVYSPVRLCELALVHLAASNKGLVKNVSSVASEMPAFILRSYSPSKACLSLPNSLTSRCFINARPGPIITEERSHHANHAPSSRSHRSIGRFDQALYVVHWKS